VNDDIARAVLIAAALCVAAGVLSAVLIRGDGLAGASGAVRRAGTATHTTDCVAIPATRRREPVDSSGSG